MFVGTRREKYLIMQQWMRGLFSTLVILVLFSSASYAIEPAYMTGMRIKPSPTQSRIIFNLSRKTTGIIKYAPNPDRLMIEFENTKKKFTLQQAQLIGANITSISTQETQTGVRFFLNVTGKVTWTVQIIPVKGKAVQIQIDIFSAKKNAPTTLKPITPPAPIKPITSTVPSTHQQVAATTLQKTLQNDLVSLHEEIKPSIVSEEKMVGRARLKTSTTPKKSLVYTIVIDPGHGGKDAGALGSQGNQEKNIVLAIAKRLAKKINENKNMRAILTRDSDKFLSLRERLQFTRKNDADVFIAIHADAYFDKSASGASVYALSAHGATSVAARWLAQRENHSELDGVELNELQDRSLMVRSVLIDLAQTTTTRDSLKLGSLLLDTLDNISPLHYAHVEQAPFLVLKSPDIPSVLVETGFITNPKEEKRLSEAWYQEKIAQALHKGVVSYLAKYAANRV